MMSQGIESRLPYLDYKFVNKILIQKRRENDFLYKENKFYFKKIIEEFISKEVINYPKRGFFISNYFMDYLQKKYYRNLFFEKTSNIEKLKIFKKNSLKKLLKSFLFKRIYFYRLLVLEIWLEKNMLLKKLSN